MGQYSQWLYHREVDQQLRERLKLIEQELHALQEQAAQLQDAISCTDNQILKAIATQQGTETLLDDTPSISSTPELPITLVDAKKQSINSVSPALFAWSNLPNLDAQKMPSSNTEPDRQKLETLRQPSTPHPEANLLPGDMATFIDTHQQTDPQLQIPNWARKPALNINTSEDRLKANADEYTNTSIQRWLERWGKRQPASQEQQNPQEVQNNE